MKFKELIKNIRTIVENSQEHTLGGAGLYSEKERTGPSVLTDKGTFNLGNNTSLDAINAMLIGFSSKDYIDPDGVISVIKQKLNHFGLDFACSGKLQDGENRYELVQYGSPQLGVFGQNPYADVNKTGFSQGDGIKEKMGHSLNLIATVQKQPNSLKKVNFLIVPVESSSYNSSAEGAESDCGCDH